MGARVAWPGPTQSGESQGHLWGTGVIRPKCGPRSWKVLGDTGQERERLGAFYPERGDGGGGCPQRSQAARPGGTHSAAGRTRPPGSATRQAGRRQTPPGIRRPRAVPSPWEVGTHLPDALEGHGHTHFLPRQVRQGGSPSDSLSSGPTVPKVHRLCRHRQREAKATPRGASSSAFGHREVASVRLPAPGPRVATAPVCIARAVGMGEGGSSLGSGVPEGRPGRRFPQSMRAVGRMVRGPEHRWLESAAHTGQDPGGSGRTPPRGRRAQHEGRLRGGPEDSPAPGAETGSAGGSPGKLGVMSE